MRTISRKTLFPTSDNWGFSERGLMVLQLKETTSHCSESIDLSSVAAGAVVSSTAWLAPRIWGEVKSQSAVLRGLRVGLPQAIGRE
jgi:hypothetical protein